MSDAHILKLYNSLKKGQFIHSYHKKLYNKTVIDISSIKLIVVIKSNEGNN